MRNANSDCLDAWLHEMSAAGIPLDLSVAELDVEIEQVGGAYENTIFDLPCGRAGYMIDLIITNQTSKSVRCRDIELQRPWVDSEFLWLSDPVTMNGDPYNYRFPGEGPLEIPRNLVLNHVLLSGGTLKPGGCARQGCLLGLGSHMPESLRHGASVRMTLSIIAPDHQAYLTTINLWVDRSAKIEQKMFAKAPRESVFAKESPRGLGSPMHGNIGHAPAGDLTIPDNPATISAGELVWVPSESFIETDQRSLRSLCASYKNAGEVWP
jgi:hypothetical protein